MMQLSYTRSMKSDDHKLCPKYEKVFSWIGKRWNGLILRCLANKAMRFTELALCLQTCSDKVLSERLKELEIEGLIEQIDHRYQLTKMGIELNAALDAIQTFASENL